MHRQKLAALLSQPDPDLDHALMREGARRMRQFVAGIRAYRDHPARRDVPEAPVIWHDGTTRLLDYGPGKAEAPAILVIPSLINRFDILDLDLAPSFVRTLADRGFRPLVVDWGMPGDAEKNFGLSDYVTRRLAPALEFVTKSGVGGRGPGFGKNNKASLPHPESPIPNPVHLLGYCMGGLLALALAALKPEPIRTLTLMATPWDFHKPDAALGASFLALAGRLEACLDALGYLPVDIIQSLFALFQPLQAPVKFGDFSTLDPAGIDARQFVLLEDWINDGVPLTAPVARECFRDWYGANRTAAFEWRVGGAIIDPRELKMPSYVVVPGRDRIVPPESALPLARLLPHASLHEPMTGHVGMIASRTAPHQVWAPLIHWLGEHR